jgi:tetratricopeptide (TPR) repeat protein
MSRFLWPVLVLAVAVGPAATAVKLSKPDRIPAEPTAEQVTLVREGVALHDKGDYIGAMAKYKQVLDQNPWEATALHELAFTYFTSENYQGALDTARLGAQCQSRLLPAFYAMMGNALDELGKGTEAIVTYKAAIKLNPRMGLLHYNLAISLRRAGEQQEAKAAVEAGIECDPNHASSHGLLAEIYRDLGYRIPAIMAYSRFLVLEPASARSAQMRESLQKLMAQGASVGDKPGSINIFMSEPPKGRQDEGDFMPTELAMSMAFALTLGEKPDATKKPPESEYQKLTTAYRMLGELLDHPRSKTGFATTYYAPYFAALTKAGHAEAFAAYAWQGGKVEGASDWATANQSKIEAFLAWSKAYEWPTK